ncbi:hypothetical protein O1L60_36335 [Streptomyces diastatochromogenes]|nr:hypothetical protein [Streptomyces diastatochromogenes]
MSASSPDGRSAEASCPAPRPGGPGPRPARRHPRRVRPGPRGAGTAARRRRSRRTRPRGGGFLGHAAGVEPDHVRLFAAAARLAAGTGQPPEPFYGLLRRGLPDDPGDLALRPLRAVRDALAAAAGRA